MLTTIKITLGVRVLSYNIYRIFSLRAIRELYNILSVSQAIFLYY